MEGKELLKDAAGYYYQGNFPAKYDHKYGEHDITVDVRQMVKDRVNILPVDERDIMYEGGPDLPAPWPRCRHAAFYNKCQYILKQKLAQFNNQIPIRYPDPDACGRERKPQMEELICVVAL